MPVNQTKLPVLVWIHGGAFRFGSGNSQFYDGKNMIANGRDLILVDISYRYDVFGFLYDQTNSDQIPGNQGLKDQILALHWVQDNIEFFYGDPEQVTVFGESAGAQSIASLLSMPIEYTAHKSTQRRLFSKAILQSPVMGISFHNTNSATEEAQRLLDILECPISDWYCARQKSVKEILNAAILAGNLANKTDLFSVAETWSPTIQTQILPANPFNTFQTEKFNQINQDIDLIFGFTTNEGILFSFMVFNREVNKILYETTVKTFFREDADVILEEYPSPCCSAVDRNCDSRQQLGRIIGGG